MEGELRTVLVFVERVCMPVYLCVCVCFKSSRCAVFYVLCCCSSSLNPEGN